MPKRFETTTLLSELDILQKQVEKSERLLAKGYDKAIVMLDKQLQKLKQSQNKLNDLLKSQKQKLKEAKIEYQQNPNKSNKKKLDKLQMSIVKYQHDRQQSQEEGRALKADLQKIKRSKRAFSERQKVLAKLETKLKSQDEQAARNKKKA